MKTQCEKYKVVLNNCKQQQQISSSEIKNLKNEIESLKVKVQEVSAAGQKYKKTAMIMTEKYNRAVKDIHHSSSQKNRSQPTKKRFSQDKKRLSQDQLGQIEKRVRAGTLKKSKDSECFQL